MGSGGDAVLSYGAIDAAILAVGSGEGGEIGGIAAWGPISGRIEAARSIAHVRSGGAVTATILAPQIGSVIANDATIQADYPCPGSVKAEVLSTAAAARAEVVAERALAATAIDEAIADFFESRDQSLDAFYDALDAMRSSAIEANAQAKAAAQQELAERKSTAQAAFRALQEQGRSMIAEVRRQADAVSKALASARDQIRAARNEAFAAAHERKEIEAAALQKLGTELNDAKAARGIHSALEIAERNNRFDETVASLKKAIRAKIAAKEEGPPTSFASLYWHYLTHSSEMDSDLRIWNTVAYSMIGIGLGGLAGMGAGVGIGYIGAYAGTGPICTFLAGTLTGGMVGREVGGYFGSFGGPVGEVIGSIGGDILGGMVGGRAAVSVWSRMTGVCNKLFAPCFAAGTPLLTPDGAKPIENFCVGDLILSSPEEDPNGPVEVCRVHEVMKSHGELLALNAQGQVIRVTAQHPFYVKGNAWTAAGLLQPGDLLRSHDGSWNPVQSILPTGEDAIVYNLRVEDYHTYYVGSPEWGFSVWAHNSNCYDSVDPNKLHHIFGNPTHNLAGLVSQFGSEVATLDAIQAATTAVVRQQGINGVFQVVVNVAGQMITVRGAVVNGVVRIGTAFIT